MIHKACMPVYIVIQIFLAHGRTDIQPGVVQEVLADLKRVHCLTISIPLLCKNTMELMEGIRRFPIQDNFALEIETCKR